MDHLNSFDGTPIAYLDAGDGRPSSSRTASLLTPSQLGSPGVVTHWWPRTTRAGTDARVMGLGKPHDPDAYAVTPWCATSSPARRPGRRRRRRGRLLDGFARVRRLVPLSRGPFTHPRGVADGLGATDDRRTVRRSPTHSKPTTPHISDPSARAFRAFADATGADRMALAAIQRAPLGEPAALDRIAVPPWCSPATPTPRRPTDALAARIPGRPQRSSRRSPERGQRPAFARSIVDFIEAVR